MRTYRRSVAGPFGLGLLLASLGTALLVGVHLSWAPPAPEATAADFSSHLRYVKQSISSTAEQWFGSVRQPPSANDIGDHPLSPGFTAAGAGLAVISAPIPVDVGRTRLGSADAASRLTRTIQSELQRLGCYGGRVHGIWDQPTHSAMLALTESAGSGLRVTGPDYVLLTVLQGYDSGACGRQPAVAAAFIPERVVSEDRSPKAAAVTPQTSATTLGPWPRDLRAAVQDHSVDTIALQTTGEALEVLSATALKASAPKSASRPAPGPARTKAATAETFRQGARVSP